MKEKLTNMLHKRVGELTPVSYLLDFLSFHVDLSIYLPVHLDLSVLVVLRTGIALYVLLSVYNYISVSQSSFSLPPCISSSCFFIDYSTGFGGKYGVQKDRVDQVHVWQLHNMHN